MGKGPFYFSGSSGNRCLFAVYAFVSPSNPSHPCFPPKVSIVNQLSAQCQCILPFPCYLSPFAMPISQPAPTSTSNEHAPPRPPSLPIPSRKR